MNDTKYNEPVHMRPDDIELAIVEAVKQYLTSLTGLPTTNSDAIRFVFRFWDKYKDEELNTVAIRRALRLTDKIMDREENK